MRIRNHPIDKLDVKKLIGAKKNYYAYGDEVLPLCIAFMPCYNRLIRVGFFNENIQHLSLLLENIVVILQNMHQGFRQTA